jgi:hypothetical protein
MQNKTDNENDVILAMHQVGNYKEFSCIDNCLQRFDENEDCEEAIFEQIVAKHQTTSEDQESDEDDMTKHEHATKQNNKKIIAELQLYFIQEGSEGSPKSALETCADFVQLQLIKRT